MSWERALEVDARLAAKNAVKIRAALRQTFDPKRAFLGYQATSPDPALTLPQQRARARAWAIINIRVNLEALKEILLRVWAEAFLLGQDAADEQIFLAREARKAPMAEVDWSKWKPGDRLSALILKPPRAFQRLLQRQGITFKDFSDTTLTDIGNAIGEAITLGLSADQAAKRIMTHVANPARALSIAITEQNRAISEATVARYEEFGLEKQRWLVFEPCKKCAQNAGEVRRLREPFPSGDAQPPAHPNCRCALAPVIMGFNDPAYTGGQVNPIPPAVSETEQQLISAIPVTSLTSSSPDLFDLPEREQVGQFSTPEMIERQLYQRKLDYSADSSLIPSDQIEAVRKYQAQDFGPMNRYLRQPEIYLVSESQKVIDRIAKQVDDLNKVIDKAPRLPSEVISYRGVDGEPADLLRNLGVGSVYKEPGFVSTSLNSKTAIGFAHNFTGNGMVVKIVNPQGSKGLMVTGFLNKGGADVESEWLLPAGTRFEVIGNDGKVIVVRVLP